MERLTVYKTNRGRYAVRPAEWSAIFNKYGRIQEDGFNHIAIFENKEDADFFVKAKEAEEHGKLLKLPFKPGDTVYIIQKRYTKCKYGQEFDESVCCGCEVEECDSKNEYTIVPRKMNLNWIVNELNEFGKTVFMTEQEALKALEGMKK